MQMESELELRARHESCTIFLHQDRKLINLSFLDMQGLMQAFLRDG